jgi:hypothetical protein
MTKREFEKYLETRRFYVLATFSHRDGKWYGVERITQASFVWRGNEQVSSPDAAPWEIFLHLTRTLRSRLTKLRIKGKLTQNKRFG